MNDYRLIEKIGQGAYGEVYLAFNQKGEYVAIKKVALPALAEKRGYILAQRLCHPLVVACFDSFEADGYFYMVMAYVKGVSLDKRTLTSHEGQRLIVEMLHFFRVLKKQGITYNDLKPANIIYGYDGHFYLIDYGAMSKMNDESLPRFGSKAFASPEYLAGDVVDWHSDLYSLAKTIQLVCPGLSKRQKRWLKKALQPQKKHRFRTIVGAKFAIKAIYTKMMTVFVIAMFLMTILPYQYAVKQHDSNMLLTYYPYLSEGYRLYFTDHDMTALATWQTLDDHHLFRIWNKQYLRQLSDELCYIDLSWTWDIQKQLLSHLSDGESQAKLELLKGQMTYEDFDDKQKSDSARLFLYRYWIDFEDVDNKSWLEETLSHETSFSQEYMTILMSQVALKRGKFEDLEASINQLALIDDPNKAYYQAKCALWIFDCGHYEAKWLSLAKQYLMNASMDERTQALNAMIEKRIAQWHF